jgi:hypothetical protein
MLSRVWCPATAASDCGSCITSLAATIVKTAADDDTERRKGKKTGHAEAPQQVPGGQLLLISADWHRVAD